MITIKYFIIVVTYYRWGCEHEESAIQAYTNLSKHHEGLTVSSAGFFINPEWPYLGASPDGIVNCDCCGRGTVEVKCPLCFKDGLPEDLNKSTSFCMEKFQGKWTLKRDHSYYHQVQTQLNVCKVEYCDFVVWTENSESIAVERIKLDYLFFNELLEPVKYFFIYGVLPEIIGKWYTRKPIANAAGVVSHTTVMQEEATNSSSVDQSSQVEVWCYCRLPSFGLAVTTVTVL